jgi:large subunit ribosomal protein L21
VFAIIQSGGRQVKVSPGSVVEVDRVGGLKAGEQVSIDQVLFVGGLDGGEVKAGSPYVSNARVIAVIEGETRGPKIRIFKKKRRKGFRKSGGHRATLTKVSIKDIVI